MTPGTSTWVNISANLVRFSNPRELDKRFTFVLPPDVVDPVFAEKRNAATLLPYRNPSFVFPAALKAEVVPVSATAVPFYSTQPDRQYRVLGAIKIAFDGQREDEKLAAMKIASVVARRHGADAIYLKPVNPGIFLNGWAIAWAR